MKKLFVMALALLMMLSAVSCTKAPAEVLDDVNDAVQDMKEEVAPKIIRGTIEGDVYTNPVVKLKLTKPSHWEYYSDEQLMQQMGLGADVAGIDDLEAVMKDTGTVYDMMVVDSQTGTNVSVMYENLAKSFAAGLTEEEYFDRFLKNAAGVTEFTVEVKEKKDVTLGKTEFYCAVAEITVQGATMQQAYLMKNLDGVMVFVTVTIPTGYELSHLKAMVSEA